MSRLPPGLVDDGRLRRRSRWRRRTDLRRPVFASTSCAAVRRSSDHQRPAARRLAAEIGIVEFAQPTQRSAAHVVVVVVVIAGIVVVQEARNSHDPAVRMLGRHAGRRRQRRKKMLVRVHGKVSVVVLDGTESGRRQDHLQVGAVPGIRLVVRDFDARVVRRNGRF